jgi:hypothetical protein
MISSKIEETLALSSAPVAVFFLEAVFFMVVKLLSTIRVDYTLREFFKSKYFILGSLNP